MSQFLVDYRAKHPEYDDLNDSDLSTALHGQYVNDTGADLSLDQFHSAIEFAPVELPQEPVIPTSDMDAGLPQDPTEPTLPGPQVSMLDMVGAKLTDIGRGVVSGVEGAIPQAKLQVAGMLQRNEAMDEETFNSSFNLEASPFENYEQYRSVTESLNPVTTWLGKKGKEMAAAARAEIEPSTAEQGSPEYYAEAITGSVINMVPALGVSILGRRPDIGLGIMLAQAKGGSYEAGRSEGLQTDEAEIYSTLNMIAEVVPSAIPIAKFMKPTGKFVRDMIEAGLTESAQETVTAALQAGIDKGYISPDMTWGEAASRMIDGAVVGLGAGATISAATSKMAKSLETKERESAVIAEMEAEFDRNMPSSEQEAVDSLSPDNAQVTIEMRPRIPIPERLPGRTEKPEEEADAAQDTGGVPQQRVDEGGIPADQPDIEPVPGQDVGEIAAEPVRGGEPAEPIRSEPRKPIPAIERFKKATTIDTSVDSLLTAAAKKGGLNRGRWQAEGIDPAIFTDKVVNNRVFGRPVFRKTDGMTPDDLAEMINEEGYADHEVTANEALELIAKELAGNGVYTPAGLERQAELIAQEHQDTQEQMAEIDYDPTEWEVITQGMSPEQEAAFHAAVSSDIDPAGYTDQEYERMYTDAMEAHDDFARRMAEESEAGAEDFTLAQETETDREERERQAAAALERERSETTAAEEKAQADAEVDDFVLSGSDRTADVAASRGQEDIFAPDVARETILEKPASDETAKAEQGADYGTNPVEAYDNFRKSIIDQTPTAESIKKDADNLIANKDNIIATLGKLTKAMLQQITRSPRSDFKKPQMVKQAYQSMLSAHILADSVITVFGGSQTYEEQIIEQVAKQTQEDVDNAYDKQREYRAQRKADIERHVKSLKNPETLAEFRTFIRAQGKDKLSAKQLAAYDELISESLRDEDKPKVVKGETEAIETERAQTKHTKTGADIFVVKLVNRVERDKFKELSSKAKSMGGYYSTYSKGEAIPGFQFKTSEEADQFEELLSGKDVDASDSLQAKTEVKQAKNADKLISMAEKLEESANEELSRPRETNTGRRASMAANATERAYKKLALAKTVRNIGIALQSGELVHLGKMNQVTQLEELMSAQKRAIPNEMYVSEYDGYSMNYDLKPGTTIDDYIGNAKMPELSIYGDGAIQLGRKLKGKSGFMRLGAELERMPAATAKQAPAITTEQLKKLKQAVKKGIISDYDLGFLPDAEKSIARLNRLGITTDEQLRAAIRELDTLSVERQKEDPIKKLERDLVGKKIAGYFPTPKEIVEQMIDYADIQPGDEVLEPSAGKGNIADIIKESAPDASLDLIEVNSGLRAILEAKGYNVVASDFMDYSGKTYDNIIMNPPFENFQDIDHVKHAYDLLKPGGKVVAIMGAGVKNSRKKAVEFRQWIDDMGSYIEDLPEGSFKSAERKTGVATVMVTLEKNDSNTLNYKLDEGKKPGKGEPEIFRAPGHNYIGLYRATGIPMRREFVSIDGKRVRVPAMPQRIEPIMRKLIKIAGRRIYFGKIKGRSTQGFYRNDVGEIRTKRKNDVEVLAHELAHYLDMYSNVSLPNFKKLYKNKKYSDEVKALSYTDANNKVMQIEGFAEFVRLWLTNSAEAQQRAHGFYDAFNTLLARDKKLSRLMTDMRELMHKFYFQGPDKLGQALIGKSSSFLADFEQWKYRRDSRIRQQMIDRFHAARVIEQELTDKIGVVEESAWKQLRIANGGAEGISDYIMNYGTVEFDESGDLVKNGKSLHGVLEPVKTIDRKPQHEGDSKIDILMRYFAGRRAVELHRQGRENLIPRETAFEWAKLGKDYPVFDSIHKEFQAFNDRMMEFYVQSGMITPKARNAMRSMNKDYVPFNRIREALASGGGASAGFQKLKGGTANLNDILVNIQDGITANVRAALNNKAKQRLYGYIAGHKDGAIFATKIAPDSRPVQVYVDEMMNKINRVLDASGIEFEGEIDLTDPDLLTFWQHGVKPQLNESGNIVDTVIIDGKKKYYEVQDPLLQDMLLSMNPESYSSFMNVMFGVKNFFTRMITLGVEFTGANLVRDTVGATFLSKSNFVPFVDSFKGMYSFIAKDQHFQDFLRSGGGYSSRIHAQTKEGTARRRVAVDEFGIMSVPERLLSTIDNIASAFEYGTRIGEFRVEKRSNRSDMDAGFASREISTDFSVLGANRFITGYIRTVPFLNAMVQSQDRVYREAFIKKKYDGNPTRLAMKAFMGITVPTLILYLMNRDDDDYKEIPDYEKRTNWHIKVGDDRFIKIPRPYDVGFVFATMPELFFKYLEDEKGKDFADGMIWTLTQMYGIDGTPAMMTGWWDIVQNKKWTGAPVVPKGLADVEATEQYSSNTSETFIRLGQALGVSPVKAEHMFKAYTGYLGGYLMWGTDNILWDEEKFGPKPDRKASDNIFLRRFLTTDVRPGTSTMEKFFDLKEKSDKIVATFKQTVDVRRAIKKKTGDGKFKDDKFFGLSGEEKAVLFGLNDSMNQLIKALYGKEGIKTAELQVRYDKKLTGSEKRAKLDDLWRSRNKAFMSYYTAADKAMQKAKHKSEQMKKEQ